MKETKFRETRSQREGSSSGHDLTRQLSEGRKKASVSENKDTTIGQEQNLTRSKSDSDLLGNEKVQQRTEQKSQLGDSIQDFRRYTELLASSKKWKNEMVQKYVKNAADIAYEEYVKKYLGEDKKETKTDLDEKPTEQKKEEDKMEK